MSDISIRSIDTVLDYLGGSSQAHYFSRYVVEMGATFFLVEEHYIDKDFLLDYQKFYSRSFEVIEPRTTRIHFFKDIKSEGELLEKIMDPLATKELNDRYLGFTLRKPVQDRYGVPILGRSVITPYPTDGAGHQRTFITCYQRMNLFGHELTIHTLPFQSQDRGVGACASAALWSALNQLSVRFEVKKQSLYEITELANNGVMTESRAFPSEGLTTGQICGYIRAMGLEIEYLGMNKIQKMPDKKELISNAIRTYVSAGIPVIAGIALVNEGNDPEYHAVVISGISPSMNGILSEIYVHDDQIGPFASVFSDDGFLTWKYARGGWSEYERVELDALIIPLYHKIRLPYSDVWHMKVELLEEPGIELLSFDFYELRDYKRRLLGLRIRSRDVAITRQLPRYVWAFRVRHDDGTVEESIIDATAPYPVVVSSVEFE